jgi:gamma-glutamyltranspeptidase / glutathione hydrolase
MFLIRFLLIGAALFFYCLQETYPQGAGETGRAVRAMVASEHAIASQIGERILLQGGNAVDAAVGVGFALAVAFPEAGNIGGGGFMVIRFPDGSSTSIDYREAAPGYAHEDVYLDESGKLRREWSLVGARAAGVPGSVAGLMKAWEKYGSIPLADILNPSIDLARNGFILQTKDIRTFNSAHRSLSQFPETSELFFAGGNASHKGDVFVQEDLARTLERIRDNGRDGFYSGETADRIVATMRKYDGWITHTDLASYQAIEREPVRIVYRGREIITMGPPSSGGVALAQMLLMLDNTELGAYPYASIERIHLITEVMKRAFAHRNAYIADPDFVEVPLDTLLSPAYNRTLFDTISMEAAAKIKVDGTDISVRDKSTETTHYSVIDMTGMAVSVTTTINSFFGSKLVVEGAGFLLNNEMNDFSLQPGVPDQFGLAASYANRIEPGKRMVSAMTPTIVVYRGTPVLIVGGRGGPRIISSVFHAVSNFIDYDMHVSDAIAGPVFHHQWSPDRLEYIHNTLSFRDIRKLRGLGHTVMSRRVFGRVVAIARHGDYLYGATNLYSGGGIRGY